MKGISPSGRRRRSLYFAMPDSNKDLYYGIESLQLSRKTPASSGKGRNMVVQISVDTLNSESILFIADIVNMFSWIYYIQISTVSICIIPCIPCAVLSWATSKPKIIQGFRITAVITYTFARVSVFGFSSRNLYNSSNSKRQGEFSTIGSFCQIDTDKVYHQHVRYSTFLLSINSSSNVMK